MRGGSEFRRALASAPRPAGCLGFARVWVFGVNQPRPTLSAPFPCALRAVCNTRALGHVACPRASVMSCFSVASRQGFARSQLGALRSPSALPDPGATNRYILHATCSSRALRYIVMPIVTPQRLIMSYSTSIYRVRPHNRPGTGAPFDHMTASTHFLRFQKFKWYHGAADPVISSTLARNTPRNVP